MATAFDTLLYASCFKNAAILKLELHQYVRTAKNTPIPGLPDSGADANLDDDFDVRDGKSDSAKAHKALLEHYSVKLWIIW